MKRLLATLLVLTMLLPVPSFARGTKLVNQVTNAVAILYAMDASGGMMMRCTATAFEKIGGKPDKPEPGVEYIAKYRFATAAHCIGSDNVTKERAADTKNIPFFLTFDESGLAPKRFWPARPIFVGYQSRGEDFAEFEVQSAEEWPVVPLGNEKDADEGDEFINVSVPLGLGKQVFYGTIASLFLDRPVVQGDINWKGSITLQIIGVNGGSSGSAIVHTDQKAIIGLLVGTISGSTIIAIPISKFKSVRKAVFEGKYKYYQPTVELNPDGTDAG
jgi:trypsin-like peptidase